jgi:hypothetical protein
MTSRPDAKVGDEDVAAGDLVVEVGERPSEHPGEQVLDDVFGHLLGRSGVPATLRQALSPSRPERRPSRLGA